MAYMKVIIGEYIVGIGQNQARSGGISETECTRFSELFKNKPQDPNGYKYQLRADNLEWELVKLPEPEPIDEEAGPEDYEQALKEMGVDFND